MRPNITRIVGCIELVTEFAVRAPDLDLTADARAVRTDVDVDALVRVLDGVLGSTERRIVRYELTSEQRRLVMAAEHLDQHLAFITAQREAIRARLAA